MSELRHDPIQRHWVIIATDRSRRPTDFQASSDMPTDGSFCPFCEGNEEKTPPEITANRVPEKDQPLTGGQSLEVAHTPHVGAALSMPPVTIVPPAPAPAPIDPAAAGLNSGFAPPIDPAAPNLAGNVAAGVAALQGIRPTDGSDNPNPVVPGLPVATRTDG